jgi:hypothetical protein
VRTEPLTIRGVAGPLVVTHNFFLGRYAVTVGGKPAKRISGRTFALPRSGGGTVEATMHGGFLDAYPSVDVAGVRYRTGPPIPVGLRILAFLPILLVTIGGLLGAIVGLVGAAANMAVARLPQPAALKALMMVGVLIAAVIVWYLLASVVITSTR